MASRKIQTPVPYKYTYKGIVAFYEAMDSDYLVDLWHEKEAVRKAYIERLNQHDVADTYIGWVCEKIGQVEKQMLSIQQILNARRIKG